MRSLFLAAAATLALAACRNGETATTDHGAALQAIAKLENAQVEGIRTRDGNAASGVYGADAVFIEQNGQLVRGGETIANQFKQIVDDPALSFEYAPGEKTFSDDGTMAYAVAPFTQTFTDTATGKAVTMKGTNLSVWKKQADGSWKLVADSNPAAITG